ncbi:MAG: flippase-like domain-containing protein [Pirellulales bacterium]|nr:flippase-like domain-containing protein [Pirellulales bacterium]
MITICKLLVVLGIIGYLLVQIQKEDGFSRLVSEPKQWSYLLTAQAMILLAFSSSFVRWFLLVHGLQLNFHLRDSFRLGSLGFMFNQVAPGSVGGDLLKAVFIAREQPGKRTEAVATVLIDRVIGLYAMLIIASLALSFADSSGDVEGTIRTIRSVVWFAMTAGTVGLFVVLSPWATSSKTRQLAESLPLIGKTLLRLIDALEIYRDRRGYLLGAFILALLTHSFLVTAFWCIRCGLPVQGPTFLQNTSLVPVALVAGALPGMPGGLGVMEGTLAYLYTTIGAAKSDGAIVAFTYRAMTYVVAAVGVCYYFAARKKVEGMIHDAEELAESIE